MAKPKPKAKATGKEKKAAKAIKAFAAKNKANPAPDWLRKAMTIPPKRKGRPPGSKNRQKAVEPPTPQTLKRGKKPMTASKDKPFYDPLDDPDLKAPEPAPAIVTPPPAKPKGTPLVAEAAPEVEPLFDEVAAGAEIPPENAQMLIAGTLGGSGDHHASAKRILERMTNEANWLITKGPDDTPAGMALKTKREAREKAEKEARDKADKDAKGAKKGKAAKEGEDARG